MEQDLVSLVNRHADLFGELYSALLGQQISFSGPCETWIVWPSADRAREPRADELRRQGIRVVDYEVEGEGYRFTMGNGVNRNISG